MYCHSQGKDKLEFVVSQKKADFRSQLFFYRRYYTTFVPIFIKITFFMPLLVPPYGGMAFGI